MYFLFTLFFLLSTHAKLLPIPSTSIIMYWGQDSADRNPGEPALSYYCSQPHYDIINIGFVVSFIDTRQSSCAVPNAPDLNFSNHEDKCETWDNCPYMFNCSTSIGVDIANCQRAGKKVVMSFGGGDGSYGFHNDTDAVTFAHTIWDMFFEGKGPLRPFGPTVIDGIDLDIEGGSKIGYVSFVKTLRSLMSSSGKDYIISGAPQCPFPDAFLGPKPGLPLGDAGTAFSYVSVQFYNNYCWPKSINDFWSAFEQWHGAGVKDGYQIVVGLPSAPAAGDGYVDASVICGLVPRLKTYSHFGGFMFWDASFDIINNWYSQQIRKCLVEVK